MKKIIACLTAAVLLFTVSACGKKSETDMNNAKADNTVYFLNFKPEIADIYKEIAKKYEAEKGVKVKVVTAASNTYETTLKSEIAKSDAPTMPRQWSTSCFETASFCNCSCIFLFPPVLYERIHAFCMVSIARQAKKINPKSCNQREIFRSV